MDKKIYFCGSIRGGRSDEEWYRYLINCMKRTDTVLTEHIGCRDVRQAETGNTDHSIYLRDTEWLKECDLVIAECTRPSLGVGYELAYAETLGKPVFVMYRPKTSELSAMIAGNPYFRIMAYETKEEAEEIVNVLNRY